MSDRLKTLAEALGNLREALTLLPMPTHERRIGTQYLDTAGLWFAQGIAAYDNEPDLKAEER